MNGAQIKRHCAVEGGNRRCVGRRDGHGRLVLSGARRLRTPVLVILSDIDTVDVSRPKLAEPEMSVPLS